MYPNAITINRQTLFPSVTGQESKKNTYFELLRSLSLAYWESYIHNSDFLGGYWRDKVQNWTGRKSNISLIDNRRQSGHIFSCLSLISVWSVGGCGWRPPLCKPCLDFLISLKDASNGPWRQKIPQMIRLTVQFTLVRCNLDFQGFINNPHSLITLILFVSCQHLLAANI